MSKKSDKSDTTKKENATNATTYEWIVPEIEWIVPEIEWVVPELEWS